jgi:cell division protease FtsH
LPVVGQTFAPPEHPNLQLALEAVAASAPPFEVIGLPAEAPHYEGFGLANLAAPHERAPRFEAVAPAYINVPVDVDRTLPCVSLGIWLLHHDRMPVVVLHALGDPHRGTHAGLKVEVMCADREAAVGFLARLQALMREHNVYRGKVLSFTFDDWGSFGLEFHRLPRVTRDDVILPEADLVAIEQHTMGISEHAPVLRASGRHLKRGLLLYGPPGTGKTFSVMYLCNRMTGRTTLLLSGQAAPTLGQAAALARSLEPSMLVLEDVDLIASERTMAGMADSTPLLFQLLNEMDGLDEDADVIFVLTTNRLDLLEPALATRPGRVDQAVEFKLPDAMCRRRLLDRYLRGLHLVDADIDTVIERTDGVTAAFLKELGRRAALVAATGGESPDGRTVRGEHLDTALDDMLDHARPVLQRLLGAGGQPGDT